MGLSTLLEAAKYLDFLDSSNQQHQPNQQHNNILHHNQSKRQQPTKRSGSSRRQRSSKQQKDAANAMVAMSLPTNSSGLIKQHGVPIPVASGSHHHHLHHQAASLSSSFTTGSPLSSFASTALLCSKASGVTSASSSAASSLSSSDTSSSCGEILMGDNDFNSSNPQQQILIKHSSQMQHITNDIDMQHLQADNININSSNNQSTHLQQFEINNHQKSSMHKLNIGNLSMGSRDSNQSVARYIAATSNGPQLVTMTTSSGITSSSAPIDGRLRAGQVIQTANNHVFSASGSSFDANNHFSLPAAHGTSTLSHIDGGQPTFNLSANTSSMNSDKNLSRSPSSCPPLIMTRVQPMILNASYSPSAARHHNIIAFQQGSSIAASSPTSSSSSYSRHRELHKTLEKNRRAHLRHCFEILKAELPASECVDKKTSHINIIKSAIKYVMALKQQESELDDELQRLTRTKIELTERLTSSRGGEQGAGLQSKDNQPTESQQMLATVAPKMACDDTLTKDSTQQQQQQSHHPVAEQQLSFLLSQSKID